MKKNPLQINRIGPPALVIVGRNGAGKSTLINSLFGKNVAEVGMCTDVTKEICKYTLVKSGVEIYDTPGAGGLSIQAEEAMRKFLQLDKKMKEINPIPADMIIFVFTYERLTMNEIEFYKDIENKYTTRIIMVKNYSDDVSKNTNIQISNQISVYTGRTPLLVNAKTGENIDQLIVEIIRLLPAERLIEFNMSLEKKKRRGREIAKITTLKMASQVAVLRGQNIKSISNRIESIKRDLQKLIIQAYIQDETISQEIIEITKNEPSLLEKEEKSAEGALAGMGLGSLIGIMGGPLGMLFGGAVGLLFGSALTQEISRGGASAVINIVAQGYSLSEIIEAAFKNPLMVLKQDQDEMKNWLMENKRIIIGTAKEAIMNSEFYVKDNALIGFLNNPNTTNPVAVEIALTPVIDSIFTRNYN